MAVSYKKLGHAFTERSPIKESDVLSEDDNQDDDVGEEQSNTNYRYKSSNNKAKVPKLNL